MELFKERLTKECYDELYDNIMSAFKIWKFFIYEIGPHCNASKSISFSYADCDLKPVSRHGLPVAFDFDDLYEKGFDVIGNVFSGSIKYEDFDESTRKALQTLCNFMADIETQEKSLVKALMQTDNLKETDVVIATSLHLLGKLCPGKNFFVDVRSKGKKRKCGCGCNVDVTFKETGIGNEHVWHGELDVIFESESCGDIFGAGAVSSCKRAKLDVDGEVDEPRPCTSAAALDRSSEDVDEPKQSALPPGEKSGAHVKDDSPGGKTGAEVKRQFTNNVENQASAQTIVFSLLQKNRHPGFTNFLIPFISISSSHVRIYMYDAENDIFVRSAEYPIFIGHSLSRSLVIALWMILHYRLFCCGIDPEDLVDPHMHAGFKKYVEANPDFYGPLIKCYVNSFPQIEKENVFINAITDYVSVRKSTRTWPSIASPSKKQEGVSGDD